MKLKTISLDGRALLLALILICPNASAKGLSPVLGQPDHMGWCGTSADRDAREISSALYYESLRTRRFASAGEPLSVSTPALSVDVGTILPSQTLFNLEGKSIQFEPTGTDSYRVVSTSTTFDGSGGTTVTLADDDFQFVDLGFSFTFFGTDYTRVALNSDGNVTFNSADVAITARDLFRFAEGPPRIGPFFDDLDPSTGGTVSTRSDSDGISFIWNAVPEFDATNANSFLVKLFQDGRIEFVYGEPVDATEAVVGISPGSNLGGVQGVDYSNDLPTSNLTGTIAQVFEFRSELSELALAKKFYQTHGDHFDQLIVFLGFDLSLGGTTVAFNQAAKNEVEGIGGQIFDNTEFFGSAGRLTSFIVMGSLDSSPTHYPDDPFATAFGTSRFIDVLAHEVGHQWLAFTPFQDTGGISQTILGRQDAHWSFFFDSNSSVMEGNDIDDRGEEMGDARFRTVDATNTYSALDRYLMGFLPGDDVPDMFVVEGPTGTFIFPTANPITGVEFGGRRKDLSIDAIISANGERRPSVLQAQKVIRQAFVLLVRQGESATAEQIAKVQTIHDAWLGYFNEETGNIGFAVTNLQPNSGTTATTVNIPYFQGDDQRYTGVAVANWGSTPADVLFRTFENGGAQAASPEHIINPRMITIAPGHQIAMLGEQIHGLSLSDARNGWIQFESSSSQVTGFFLDGDLDQTLLDGAVAGSETATELYFTRASIGSGVLAANSYTNLIDVINPNSQTANLKFDYVDATGTASASADRSLNANGRLAEDFASLFPGVSQPNSEGYIKLTSDVGVVGYQLIDGQSTIFALPAQPPSTATKLYSAQFASGAAGGVLYFTDLNVINTSSDSRTIQAQLIGNDGTPITAVVTIDLETGAQARRRGSVRLAGSRNRQHFDGRLPGSHGGRPRCHR